jgi:hypothetical protein
MEDPLGKQRASSSSVLLVAATIIQSCLHRGGTRHIRSCEYANITRTEHDTELILLRKNQP